MTDWKLRFYGSVLGVAWTLLKPFAFFGVIYVVFVKIVNLGADVHNFAGYILLSIVLFSFFAEITGGSVPGAASPARTCCERCASRTSSSRCRSPSAGFSTS